MDTTKRRCIAVAAAMAVSTVLLSTFARATPPTTTTPAATAATPVLVVDIVADSPQQLDAQRVRSAIGRELSVDAVAPDDPRAASATARLTIDAQSTNTNNKKLTVTFRRKEITVTRSVAMPDEKASAESSAVILAGNVARDEAGELLGTMKPKSVEPDDTPSGGSPASSSVEEKADLRAVEDMKRMRVFLKDATDADRERRRNIGLASLGLGAAMAAPGLYLVGSESPDHARGFGHALAWGGFFVTGFGIAQLIPRGEDPLAELSSEANKKDPMPKLAGYTVDVMEKRWEQAAKKARSGRKLTGVALTVVGGLGVATASTMVFVMGPHDFQGSSLGMLGGLGALNLITGVVSLASETPIESAYRTWKTLRGGSDAEMRAATQRTTIPNATFGMAPLQGGGGMASLSVVF